MDFRISRTVGREHDAGEVQLRAPLEPEGGGVYQRRVSDWLVALRRSRRWLQTELYSIIDGAYLGVIGATQLGLNSPQCRFSSLVLCIINQI